MSDATTMPPEALLAKVDFIRRRLARIDGLSSALWWMSYDADLSGRHRNFDDFRGAVEAIAGAQDDATTGVYDALEEVDRFLSS